MLLRVGGGLSAALCLCHSRRGAPHLHAHIHEAAAVLLVARLGLLQHRQRPGSVLHPRARQAAGPLSAGCGRAGCGPVGDALQLVGISLLWRHSNAARALPARWAHLAQCDERVVPRDHQRLKVPPRPVVTVRHVLWAC